MAARTGPRVTRPRPTPTSTPGRPGGGRDDQRAVRLSWWSLALPLLAFAALLAVAAATGHPGHAATPVPAELLARLRDLVPVGTAGPR